MKSSDVKYIPEGEWITSVSQVCLRKCHNVGFKHGVIRGLNNVSSVQLRWKNIR